MPATSSVAQNLPSVILEAIIGYIALVSDGNAALYKAAATVSALQCCKSWRVVCQSLVCSDVNIAVANEGDIEWSFTKWPNKLAAPPSFETVSSMVRSVQISISSWKCVFSRSFLNMPAWMQLSKLRFPRARHFELVIRDPYWFSDFSKFSDDDVAQTIDTINSLFDLFKRLVPDPNSIRINWPALNSSHHGLKIIKHLAQRLSDLATGVSTINLIDSGTIAHTPINSYVCISPITSFSYTSFCNRDLVFEIVRRNSTHLQTLRLSNFRENNAKQLLYSADETTVEYPRLETLYLNPGYSDNLITLKTDKEFVPFPALKRLIISRTYPFGDDVVFRGSSDTLEYLKLPVYNEFVDMIGAYGCFNAERFTRLSSVILGITRPFSFDSDTEEHRLFLFGYKVMESVTHGNLLDFAFKRCFVNAISLEKIISHPLLTNLRSLDLIGINVKLVHVAAVLQNCPLINMLAITPDNGALE
ncbi:hypothetical protein GGF39_002182 [Coemansia sp. RSA 1721]|nr:hypothetical protein GGF39_002182 [Coemansia sp. RSA 1721]